MSLAAARGMLSVLAAWLLYITVLLEKRRSLVGEDLIDILSG